MKKVKNKTSKQIKWIEKDLKNAINAIDFSKIGKFKAIQKNFMKYLRIQGEF